MTILEHFKGVAELKKTPGIVIHLLHLNAGTEESAADWDWVAERLASRDSVVRPETEMTFYDFLDNFDCKSEDYDTDLEEDFIMEEKKVDPTGVQDYIITCEKKGK